MKEFLNLNKTFILISLLLLIFHAILFAQSDIRDIKFENISIKDGLSQSSPNCIFQDTKGLIWIGTEDGLNKYDGYSFQIYKPDPNDSFSISHSRILTIYEDSEKNMWIGTNEGGLNQFERSSEKFYHFHMSTNEELSLAGNVVKCILQLNSNELWIGTEQGLSILDSETKKLVDIKKVKPDLLPLLSTGINTFAYDSSGVLWIGTVSGLYYHDLMTGELMQYSYDPMNSRSLPDNVINTLLIDSHKNLWIGTESGLSRKDQGSPDFTRPDSAFATVKNQNGNVIKALYEDEYGHIWIGTFGDGLFIYLPESDQFIKYTYDYVNPYSLSNNEILSIFCDHSGIIWIGSNGLDRYNPKKEKFKLYDYVPYTDENLIFRNIHPIYEDVNNVLWIGSKGDGLHILDRGNKTYKRLLSDPDNPNSLPSNRIRAILENPENVLWVGTDDQGMCKIYLDDERNPVQYISYQYNRSESNSISGNTVYDLFLDQSGDLWIGTDNGLTIMDIETETFTRYLPDPENPASLSNTTAYTIYADQSGDIWIATDYGVNKYDPAIDGFVHNIHEERDTNTIIHNEIMAFHEDAEGFLWIGTYGFGIDRFDKSTNSFKHYSHIPELSKAVIYGILEDGEHNLWLSTNNGIIRFNPKTEQTKVFSVEDGLQSNEFNGTSYYKSNSGEMFFGGQYGFNSFYPREVLIDSIVPQIILTDLLVNNNVVVPGENAPISKHVSEINEIILGHRENNFTLYFSALHFANPEHNRYKYKLVGFDDQWIDAGTRRFVSYTNLPYRSYTFRVLAANSDGVWNEEGLSVKIRVKPPFWSTFWFRLLIILLIIAAIYYFYKKRTQFLEKQKQILQEKIEQSNQELKDATEKLTKQQEEIIIQKRELRLREKDQQELLWFNQGISTFSDIVSKHKHDIKGLCQNVINNIIEYVEAQQGGIFLIQDDDEDDPYLELIAYHAYSDEKINKQFKPGEGYVGTCFIENKFLEIDNLSNDYAVFQSGLGKETLKHLILFPLKVSDTCIGVIELASFKKLKGFRISFVEKLIETLASTINTERANLKMKKIIDESERQAREIQEREHQLRIQLEENMAKQEESNLRESEFTRVLEEAAKREENLNKQIKKLKTALASKKKDLD